MMPPSATAPSSMLTHPDHAAVYHHTPYVSAALPRVAYFSMEMAIDPSLKTYAGGLGFLAGSNMLSAGHLDMPMVGVTMLWTCGYAKQVIHKTEHADTVSVEFEPESYPWLTDTGVTVEVQIFGEPVKVKAYRLEPEKFGTCPVYFLTTDIPENTPEQRFISQRLYDAEQRVRISQEIVLGIGGIRVLRAIGEQFDMVHLNEGHALPAAFEMLQTYNGNMEAVRERMVFTTHTPVAAGNEAHPAHLLAEAGFFAGRPLEEAVRLGGEDFSLTVAALRMSRLANGVSQLHGQVANQMWQWVNGRCPIIAITNAVFTPIWQDERVRQAVSAKQDLLPVKRDMKIEMIDAIRQETGKELNPDVLTIVWARRFTDYKRAWLLFYNEEKIARLLEEGKLQIIFSGKFHPSDTVGKETFNRMLGYAKHWNGMAVMPNYDLELSNLLKRGGDIWLNTPTRPLEASGTSGMSANLNGTLHVTTYDGWSPEGTFHGHNGFVINEKEYQSYLSVEERHRQDYESMMSIIENDLIPAYYNNKPLWNAWMRRAVLTAETFFHSDRMVMEYYNRLYKPVHL
ncbi:MAG: alpha-glucan family phosphorylase [Vampirovibrionales bacterium]|nr:alpha-glucan family phosphorylase [Vampirovibrionales bacterium]